MTNEEAIEDLKALKRDLYSDNGIEMWRDYEISIPLAISALEKQILKKPISVSGVKDGSHYVGRIGKCTCCNEIIDETNIVCDCGQKLDWSEKDE